MFGGALILLFIHMVLKSFHIFYMYTYSREYLQRVKRVSYYFLDIKYFKAFFVY